MRIFNELRWPVRLEDHATLTFLSRLVEYSTVRGGPKEWAQGEAKQDRIVNNLVGLGLLACVNCAQGMSLGPIIEPVLIRLVHPYSLCPCCRLLSR